MGIGILFTIIAVLGSLYTSKPELNRLICLQKKHARISRLSRFLMYVALWKRLLLKANSRQLV